jgi:Fe-Mn family superoxide dismutase
MAMLLSSTQVLASRHLVAHGPSARRNKVRNVTRAAFELADLPYPADALEPKISKATLDVHWGKHHRTYVTNLNGQIEGSDLEGKSLEEVILATWNNGSPKPAFNNAAQAWNHEFYWESMSPKPVELKGDLKADIESTFGSVDAFNKEFSTAGATQFGSGWAWLVVENGKLAIKKTPNAENPITSGAKPILVMDVWEHAYYLDVQNRRPEYISTFVNELINWDKVAERYAAAK